MEYSNAMGARFSASRYPLTVQCLIKTDIKYLYGWTDNAIEEMEYVNAVHVFADILGMARDQHSKDHPHQTTLPETTKRSPRENQEVNSLILKR